MGADLGTIVILFLIFFGILEFALVIIPAMIGRSKVRLSSQPVFDVPIVLSRPVSPRQVAQMRSWYFDETGAHRYHWNINPDHVTPVHSDYPGRDSLLLPGGQPLSGPGQKKDWKAINKANRAILRANKAVLEADQAILEANTAIQQAGEDDLEWIDEIAGFHQLRYPPRR